MDLQLQGTKKGMTQVFDDQGNSIPCTVILLEKNVIAQIKTLEKDGYRAVQLAAEPMICKDPRTIVKRIGKPRVGHFEKNGLHPHRSLSETRVSSLESYEVGKEYDITSFNVGDFVDITGFSKGKGYQGVMKLHGFSGFAASHGAGPVHRHAGSTGQRSTPGRCFPGGKRASRMGNNQVTTQSLRVVAIDIANNLLVVKGAVSGPRSGRVQVALALKKAKKSAK